MADLTKENSGSFLDVSLADIIANYQDAKIKTKADVAAVLKTDAYGLGADVVGPCLERAGCRTFFTAYGFEGLALRRVLSKSADIYILHGPMDGEENDFIGGNLIPVLSTERHLSRWTQAGGSLPCALHVDTGLNRLGFREVPKVSGLNVSLVLSHLACPEDPVFSDRQLERFQKGAKNFPGAKKSLGASASLDLPPEYHFDMIRAGYALYVTKKRQCLNLKSKILQIQTIEAGETVGYGAAFTADRKTVIATAAIGYGDGLSRALSNRGIGAVGPHRVPMVGRLSMDLLTFDVTDVPADVLAREKEIEIVGKTIRIEEVAEKAGTIPYEILTSLGKRYLRNYRF